MSKQNQTSLLNKHISTPISSFVEHILTGTCRIPNAIGEPIDDEKWHSNILTSENNLAGFFKSGGRYDTAERLHPEFLCERRDTLGDRRPDTLTSINNSQGRCDEAEPLNAECLRVG